MIPNADEFVDFCVHATTESTTRLIRPIFSDRKTAVSLQTPWGNSLHPGHYAYPARTVKRQVLAATGEPASNPQSHCTYAGFVCLMRISSRKEVWIVDLFKPRDKLEDTKVTRTNTPNHGLILIPSQYWRICAKLGPTWCRKRHRLVPARSHFARSIRRSSTHLDTGLLHYSKCTAKRTALDSDKLIRQSHVMQGPVFVFRTPLERWVV